MSGVVAMIGMVAEGQSSVDAINAAGGVKMVTADPSGRTRHQDDANEPPRL